MARTANSTTSASEYQCPPYVQRTHEDGDVYSGKLCIPAGQSLWVVLFDEIDTYKYLSTAPAKLTGVNKTYWSATLPSAAVGTARIVYLIGSAKCQANLDKGKRHKDGTITVSSNAVPDCTRVGSE